MFPPLPPSPFRPQSLSDRILDLQSVIRRIDAENDQFREWIETARGHLDAGRFTAEQFEFARETWRRQIASNDRIRIQFVIQLDETRAAYAAQVAEGAAFDAFAAKRHAATLAGQPAPAPAEEGATAEEGEPAPAQEGGADE